MCIRDLDKPNLIWRFDFRPQATFPSVPVTSKNTTQINIVVKYEHSIIIPRFSRRQWFTLDARESMHIHINCNVMVGGREIYILSTWDRTFSHTENELVSSLTKNTALAGFEHNEVEMFLLCCCCCTALKVFTFNFQIKASIQFRRNRRNKSNLLIWSW